jgi:hypothetical protein
MWAISDLVLSGQKTIRADIYTGNKKLGTFTNHGRVHEVAFSSDGGKYAIQTYKKNIYTENKEWGPFDKISFIEFSPDGKTLAFTAKTGNDWYIYTENEKYGPFTQIKECKFSADSSAISFKALNNKLWTSYIIYKGKLRTGSISNEKKVYLDGAAVVVE